MITLVKLILLAPPFELTELAAADPDPSIDYTITDTRAEYTATDKRPEYTLLSKRPEYTALKS